MERTRHSYAMRAVAVLAGMLISLAGVGTASGQEHNDDHGGGGHDTTPTTGPTTPTTGPGGTPPTTQPGGSTKPTRPTQPGEQTSSIQYGPYTFQGASGADPVTGHAMWHSGNQFAFNVQKPCNNCYITGMTARLVAGDRTTELGQGNGRAMLHHMLLANTDWDKTDATCEVGSPFPLGLMFGQRFFASGDERTPTIMPPGYGYHVGTGGWNLIWEGASENPEAQQVYYEVKFTWVPDSAAGGFKNVEPIWFDVAQCGFSTFTAPAGPSTKSWTWTVNRPGVFLGVGGHGHDGTTNIEVRNDSTGELICDSRAGYGETPLYLDPHGHEHLSSMSQCGGVESYSPAGSPITNGQRITITGHYDQQAEVTDQMGIVMGFVGEPSAGGGGGGGGGGSGGCQAAMNSAHVQAGRATSWLIFAWAKGSNNYLGLTFSNASLQEGPTGTWTRVNSCT